MSTPVKTPAKGATTPDKHPTTAPPAGTATEPGTPATAPETASKPGRKAGQKAKEYDFSALSLDVLAAPMAVSEELATKAAPARTRDEKQLKIDAVVKQLHNDWIARDKPTAWANQPKAAYAVDPRAVEGLQYLINRAASYHGVSVKYGSVVRNADGRQVVTFSVRDMRTRKAGESTKGGAKGETAPAGKSETGF